MGLTRVALAIAVGIGGAVANPAAAPAGANLAAPQALPVRAVSAGAPSAGAESASAERAAAGMTVGYVVLDRATGRYTKWYHGNHRFRSASVVKLLIALDHLWTRDPADMRPHNRRRLGVMLRRSDDAAASYFWARNGYRGVVLRMNRRLGLTDTAPPPRRLRGWWGYTAMTAADTARIYRYILTEARQPVRRWIMWRLRHATPRGTDGFYQRFGVLALGPPKAAKQGWSADAPAGPRIKGLNLRALALHTTGVVGAHNRFVVVAFTLHPRGTRFSTARAKVTRLVRPLLR
jgi:hypothetical protein